MNVLLIFIWVYLAMIATSYWEAYVEGRKAWDEGKFGWKLKIGKFVFTGYHFYLWYVMWPLLMTLPLVVNGWDTKLFGILASAYVSGTVIEDFMWYVVNPEVKFKEFNTKFANYYPRIKIGKIYIPVFYIFGIVVSAGFWYFLWR